MSTQKRDYYPELGTGPGAKWIKSLTNDRTGQFTGSRYPDLDLTAVLFTEKKDGKDYVELNVWSAPGRSKPTFKEAMNKEFKPAKKGDRFGPSCSYSLLSNSHILSLSIRDQPLVEGYSSYSNVMDKI